MSQEQQAFFMRYALTLGEKGRVTAPPNPWVGCVIVREGEIVGEGYHQAPGEDHAEIVALNQAGTLAKGATAYISLEPCAHQGKTPPCVPKLIESGISHVVIPFLDPDPHVSGKGVALLKKGGVTVTVGIASAEAEQALLPYLVHRKTGRPFCLLKTAMSLDGKVAAQDGSSQWITGEEARRNVHLLRAQSQAILIGVGTAKLDQPRLTVRGVPVGQQPLRIVLDPRGSLPAEGPLFDTTEAPTWIFTTTTKRLSEWEAKKVEGIVLSEWKLPTILDLLGKRGIVQLLIEGGPATHTNFLEEKLVDRLAIYVGGCLLGNEGKPLTTWPGPPSIKEALRFELEAIHRFGDTVRLDYK